MVLLIEQNWLVICCCYCSKQCGRNKIVKRNKEKWKVFDTIQQTRGWCDFFLHNYNWIFSQKLGFEHFQQTEVIKNWLNLIWTSDEMFS